jgi:hypothetical protein
VMAELLIFKLNQGVSGHTSVRFSAGSG